MSSRNKVQNQSTTSDKTSGNIERNSNKGSQSSNKDSQNFNKNSQNSNKNSQNTKNSATDYVSGDSARSSSSHQFHSNNGDK